MLQSYLSGIILAYSKFELKLLFFYFTIRHMNNLRRIDLNLLVTLHALLMEKHVSRAALRLHKSQPAVSHALAHLRTIFDDPLLIRRSGKLELTSRANELLPPLTDVLLQLGALIDAPKFDPRSAKRTFRLSMSDYGARVLLPDLVRSLRVLAPDIDLEVSQGSREAMLADVFDGETDIALGVFPHTAPDGLCMHTLFVESFACLADKDTLPESGHLDRDSWLARPHILVAMRSGRDNEVEQALSSQGLHRRVVMTLPHWGVANQLVAGTDLILTAARRSFDMTDRNSQVQIFEPPFPIEPFDFKLLWHQRRESDAAHNWLRQLIISVITKKLSEVS